MFVHGANPTQPIPTQSNPTEPTEPTEATEPDCIQSSSQSNPFQLNSIHPDSTQFNQTQLNPTQPNSA